MKLSITAILLVLSTLCSSQELSDSVYLDLLQLSKVSVSNEIDTDKLDYALDYAYSKQYYSPELGNKIRDLVAQISESIQYNKGIYSAKNDQGIIELGLGNYDKSIALFIECADYHRSQKKYDYCCKLYNNIGTVYLKARDTFASKTFFNRSLKLKDSLQNPDLLVIAYNKLSFIYHRTNKDTSEIFYRKAEKIALDNKDTGTLAEIYSYRAEIFDPIKDRQIMEDLYHKIIQLAKDSSRQSVYASGLSGLGTVNCRNLNYKAAYDNYDQIKKLSIYKVNKQLQLSTRYGIVECLYGLGNYKLGYEELWKALQLEREMFNDQKEALLKEYQVKFNLAEVKSNLELETKKNENLLISEKLRKLINIFLAIGIILIAILSYLFLQNRKRKFQLKKAQLEQDLNNLKSEIDILKVKIQESITIDPAEKIQVDIVSINNTLHDPLTSRELEIVEQLYSGKTNKSIAESLFISVPTVKSHLQNVYSKLGVSNRVEAIKKVQ